MPSERCNCGRPLGLDSEDLDGELVWEEEDDARERRSREELADAAEGADAGFLSCV